MDGVTDDDASAVGRAAKTKTRATALVGSCTAFQFSSVSVWSRGWKRRGVVLGATISISSSISSAAPTLLLQTNTSRCSCRCKPSAVLSSPSAKTALIFAGRRGVGKNWQSKVRCNSSSRTPESGSGDNDSKTILDAFFLGKAFAEALNERIESTVGEILSMVAQLQAEQQKQVLDFQEEVMVRAKKAKEKAALQVMEEQGVTSKPLAATSNGSTPVLSSSIGHDADVPPEKLLES